MKTNPYNPIFETHLEGEVCSHDQGNPKYATVLFEEEPMIDMGVEKNADGSYKAVRHDYLGRLIYGDELFDPEIDHEDENGNRVYRCRRGVLLEYGIRITKTIINEEGKPQDQEVHIADFGKHNIILFNSHFSSNYHQEVYEEFNAVLDYISYKYMLTMGRLPKYNLVAHSRGGVVNAMYTIEHPYNVASLVSVDTPYYGIAFGELASAPNMPQQIIDMAGGVLGSGGAEDFLNPYYQDYMRNRWNEMIAAHPDANINAHAIGSAASESFLREVLLDPGYNFYLLYDQLFGGLGVSEHLNEYRSFAGGFIETFLNGILYPQDDYVHVMAALAGMAVNSVLSFLDFGGELIFQSDFISDEAMASFGGQLLAELMLGVADGFLSNTFLYKIMPIVLPTLLPWIINTVPEHVYLLTAALNSVAEGKTPVMKHAVLAVLTHARPNVSMAVGQINLKKS
jgi:hypothetical protein